MPLTVIIQLGNMPVVLCAEGIGLAGKVKLASGGTGTGGTVTELKGIVLFGIYGEFSADNLRIGFDVTHNKGFRSNVHFGIGMSFPAVKAVFAVPFRLAGINAAETHIGNLDFPSGTVCGVETQLNHDSALGPAFGIDKSIGTKYHGMPLSVVGKFGDAPHITLTEASGGAGVKELSAAFSGTGGTVTEFERVVFGRINCQNPADYLWISLDLGQDKSLRCNINFDICLFLPAIETIFSIPFRHSRVCHSNSHSQEQCTYRIPFFFHCLISFFYFNIYHIL